MCANITQDRTPITDDMEVKYSWLRRDSELPDTAPEAASEKDERVLKN